MSLQNNEIRENKINVKKRRDIMSNPKNFIILANKIGIYYEHLLEGKECLGSTNLARLFEGNSSRGGINSTCLDCWINTFEYINKNPEHIDNEIPKPFTMKPTEEYFDFVTRISNIIPNENINKWKNMSKIKLSEEAKKYDIIRGIKNRKALDTLLDRMIEMFNRRKLNIWEKNFEKIDINIIDNIHTKNEEILNYNMKNVPELRRLCKERNLANAHLKKKEDIVKLLEDNPMNAVYNEIIDVNNELEYEKLNTIELKSLAKDRGLTLYNNLKKDELVNLHKDYDQEMHDEHNEIKETDNNIIDTFIFQDKKIRIVGENDNPWFVAKDISDILDIKDNRVALRNIPDKWKDECKILTLGGNQNMIIINEPAVYKLVMRSNKPNAQPFQEFVCEEILPTIRKKGEYKLQNENKMILQRPIRQLMNLTEIDIEAEKLESQFNWSFYSNKSVIYIAYIGKGLIKIGYSDKRLSERERKHTSCESEYEQFRFIKAFEVSGEPIEKLIKDLLLTYKTTYNKQKEIFKPKENLIEFCKIVQNLIENNDLRYQLDQMILKYKDLKIKNKDLEIEILKLKNLDLLNLHQL
jgi:anti-repressor protein